MIGEWNRSQRLVWECSITSQLSRHSIHTTWLQYRNGFNSNQIPNKVRLQFQFTNEKCVLKKINITFTIAHPLSDCLVTERAQHDISVFHFSGVFWNSMILRLYNTHRANCKISHCTMLTSSDSHTIYFYTQVFTQKTKNIQAHTTQGETNTNQHMQFFLVWIRCKTRTTLEFFQLFVILAHFWNLTNKRN